MPGASGWLSGECRAAIPLPGDYDFDGDIDGNDLLRWQLGESPQGMSASDLAEWQSNFGEIAPPSVAIAAPEPATWVILTSLALVDMKLWMRRQIHS